MRSGTISLDRHGSKVWEVSRCRPAVSNETFLASRPEFFLTKVATVQLITEIVIFEYLFHPSLPFSFS